MTKTITVSEDTTLGAEHSGVRIIVDAPATLILSHEDTYKNIAGDENEIISCVAGDVKIEGETGVTVIPTSSVVMTKKGASVKVLYKGNNTYFIWGSLCIALIAGIAAVTYKYDVTVVKDSIMILINGIK